MATLQWRPAVSALTKLPGFASSAVSLLTVSVNNYAALWEMLRNDY